MRSGLPLLKRLSRNAFLRVKAIGVARNNLPPHQIRRSLVNLPRIPALPHLVSQFVIHQQGFDIDFGEHGLRLA
jgi:hypothetical protein